MVPSERDAPPGVGVTTRCAECCEPIAREAVYTDASGAWWHRTCAERAGVVVDEEPDAFGLLHGRVGRDPERVVGVVPLRRREGA